MEGIYCLTFEGGPLNDPIRNLLYDLAQELMETGDENKTFKTSTGEGEIHTDGEQATVGGIYGTLFRAELDTQWGSFEVTYIVRPSSTVRSKDGVWFS